jgi:prolyl oligopeptidase
VVCQVPLLDMKRYNKLLAGASWMAEYGNPDTEDWDNYMKSWSPYQNLDEADYPEVFFTPAPGTTGCTRATPARWSRR